MMDDHTSIVLVTCEKWPTLFDSDQALADELAARGHRVMACPWNDAPLSNFIDAGLVVLRSNWDFHSDLAGFDLWLTEIEGSGVELHNPAVAVREFLDKGYLERLGAAGFPTPLTRRFDDLDDAASEWVAVHGLERLVIKPAWGASGDGVELVDADGLAGLRDSWCTQWIGRSVIVQGFVPQISEGERALVFLGGEYSHALLRSPAAGDFRVNGQYGGTTVLATDVDRSMIDLGKRVLAGLPAGCSYARIDMVGRGADLMLMEVEVNEPALGLHLAPGSAARFADALLGANPSRI